MPLKKIIFETTFSKYSTMEVIGEGGSGRIYKVSEESGKIWALKLLSLERLTGDSIKRFKNEILFCLNNKHKNIVSVVDHGIYKSSRDDTTALPFYVMPLYDRSLRKMLNDSIPINKALLYFSQLLDGVEAAHLQNVVHRDIKPENVLYDLPKDRLLISDFGIAHFEEEELFTAVETKNKERLANFQYAAPEQRDRKCKVDHRADIYALGLILNEMFTGQVPYGTGYKKIVSVASEYEYLDELIEYMLRQTPEERPESIETIKVQIQARKNEYINRQKLSELKKSVIPVAEVDDPLIIDPPRLIGFDWDRGNLELVLNRPVNSKWVWALQNMGNYGSLLGKEPERFSFPENRARINAREDEVQDIINFFKSWLPRANEVYERRIRSELREEEEKRTAELRRQIAEKDARRRVLEKVRI